MNHIGKPLVVLSCICLFLGGCFGLNQPLRKVDFYTLEYDPPKISGKKPLPCTLRIERFQVSPVYDTVKFVFREKKFHRDNYNYHKWRANPRDLITYYFTRDMRESLLFKGIFSHESLYPSSHLISGTIDEFYEHDGEPWEAVLSLNIVLLKEIEPDLSKRILFQKNYTTRKPCQEKTPQALVEAMGNAMSALSEEIIIDIYQYLYDSH